MYLNTVKEHTYFKAVGDKLQHEMYLNPSFQQQLERYLYNYFKNNRTYDEDKLQHEMYLNLIASAKPSMGMEINFNMENVKLLVLCQEKVQIKCNHFFLCLAKLNLLFLSHFLLDFSDILPHIGLGINTRNGCEYVLYCKMFLCIQKSTYMHVYN